MKILKKTSKNFANCDAGYCRKTVSLNEPLVFSKRYSESALVVELEAGEMVLVLDGSDTIRLHKELSDAIGNFAGEMEAKAKKAQ